MRHDPVRTNQGVGIKIIFMIIVLVIAVVICKFSDNEKSIDETEQIDK